LRSPSTPVRSQSDEAMVGNFLRGAQLLAGNHRLVLLLRRPGTDPPGQGRLLRSIGLGDPSNLGGNHILALYDCVRGQGQENDKPRSAHAQAKPGLVRE
jgi:hypothetical protein